MTDVEAGNGGARRRNSGDATLATAQVLDRPTKGKYTADKDDDDDDDPAVRAREQLAGLQRQMAWLMHAMLLVLAGSTTTTVLGLLVPRNPLSALYRVPLLFVDFTALLLYVLAMWCGRMSHSNRIVLYNVVTVVSVLGVGYGLALILVETIDDGRGVGAAFAAPSSSGSSSSEK